MPWIKQDDCVGCGICVEQCPQNTILMRDGKAYIDMANCIRCGQCHEICPQEAVRHDSEKIPEKVQNNVETARRLLEKCGTEEVKISYLNKYLKSFKLQVKVADKSSGYCYPGEADYTVSTTINSDFT